MVFEKILLENGGLYTLFGTKPLTDITIPVGQEDNISLKFLSEASRERVVYLEYPGIREYEDWKQFVKKLSLKKFCVFEKTAPYDPLHMCCFVMNIEEAKKVFKKHQQLFIGKLGKEISFEKILEEATVSQSPTWDTILRDHQLMGLFYGYGEENVSSFGIGTQVDLPSNSEGKEKLLDFLPLPRYAVSKDDHTKDKYKAERSLIQKRLKNKDMVKESLKKLIEK